MPISWEGAMSKRLFRSFISLFLVLTVVLSVSGLISEDVYAATLATDIAGLTASYTNGEWTASGSTLSGSATGVAGGGCGSSASSTTSTLTLTNSSGSTAQLSFDYARPTLGSGGSVTIDGTAVNAAGSFQKELASGGSINVVIVSGSAGAYTSSITLNNVSVTVKKNVTTTFAMPQGSGTYSYNGNQVVTQVSDTRLSTEGYRLVATPASGYKLEGWYSATKNTFFSTDSSFTAYFDEDQTIYPVFIPSDSPVWEVGTKWFTDLNEAITYSSKIGRASCRERV